MVPRCTQPQERASESRSRFQAVEVGPVDGRGSNADEHLAVRGHRTLDVPELYDIGRAISVPKGRLHRVTSSGCVASLPAEITQHDKEHAAGFGRIE